MTGREQPSSWVPFPSSIPAPGWSPLTVLGLLYQCPYSTPSPYDRAGQPRILSLAPIQGFTGVDRVRPGLFTVLWEPQRPVKTCTEETGLLTTLDDSLWSLVTSCNSKCKLLELRWSWQKSLVQETPFYRKMVFLGTMSNAHSLNSERCAPGRRLLYSCFSSKGKRHVQSSPEKEDIAHHILHCWFPFHGESLR